MKKIITVVCISLAMFLIAFRLKDIKLGKANPGMVPGRILVLYSRVPLEQE